MPADRFGRNIHYLRVSLTDKCNLRCIYCMGEDSVFRPNSELMQPDELLLLIQLFTELGFDKFRLTGGEPTLHPHLIDIVREIHNIPGVRSLSMTTNGILMDKLAMLLAEAGLQRVNISLDTLDPIRFKRISRGGNLEQVSEGIRASDAAGLTPLKFNMVVMRGFNDDDIVELARLTIDQPWYVRYIEMMPLGDMANFAHKYLVRDTEIVSRIEGMFGTLEVLNNGRLDGEARMYRIQGACGSIGLISSVSHPFCAHCTRARLTADGVLRLCLLRDKEVNLLTPLRLGATIQDLKQLILTSIWDKPWGHGLSDRAIPSGRVMSQIGG